MSELWALGFCRLLVLFSFRPVGILVFWFCRLSSLKWAGLHALGLELRK